MPAPRPELDKKQLHDLIENIKEFVLSKNPTLVLKSKEAELNSIINKALAFIHHSGNEKGLTMEKACDKTIMDNLAQAMTAAITITKTLNESPEFKKLDKILDELTKDPDFKKEFEKIAKSDKNDEEKNKDLEQLLKKHLDKNPKLEKIDLKELSKLILKELRNELHKSKDSPEPTQQDAYSNLFGLINSKISGGLQIPLTCYAGNGLGFNDWNPNNGNAPIDSVNSLKDTQFGDALGLNARTARNFLSIPETAIDSFTALLKSAGLSNEAPETPGPSAIPRPGATPTLKR